MFFGVSHVLLPVTQLERSAHLWCEVMGFAETGRGEDYLDIDTGSVIVRLLRVATVESKQSLRVTVLQVDAAYRQLLAAGALDRYAPMRTPEREEMACVSDPDGHAIVLWRALSEDEFDCVPELPKEVHKDQYPSQYPQTPKAQTGIFSG